MSFVIRRAIESDATVVVELRRQLFHESNYMLWEPAEFTATAEDEARRIARLNARRNSIVLIAEDNADVALGLLTAVGGEVRRLRHAATLALGVRRDNQGLGIATALLAKTISWAQGAGLKRLELTVHTSNLRAVALYLRSGFVVEGLRRASLLVDGVYTDEYLMSVLLNDTAGEA